MARGGGFSPSAWGGPYWHVLRMVALNYPETPTSHEEQEMRKFIQCVGATLPCDLCKTNFQRSLARAGFWEKGAFASRDSAFSFVVRLEQEIHLQNGKTAPPPFDEATLRAAYERFRDVGSMYETRVVSRPKTSEASPFPLSPAVAFRWW